MDQDSFQNRSKFTDSQEHDSSQSLGSFLQRERLKKQLTLEQVAEHTCIHIASLRAIEENDRSKMPAEVFSRGFIKLYAAHLGLDPQEILERYIRELSRSDEEGLHTHDIFSNEKLAESRSLLNPGKVALFLLMLFLGALGYYFFFYGSSMTPYVAVPFLSRDSEMAPPTAAPSPPIAEEQPAVPAAAPAPPAEVSAVDSGESAPLPLAPPEGEVGGQSAAPPPAADNAAATSQEPDYTLRIVFSERTWMQTGIDDEAPRNFLFDPGEEKEWRAHKQLRLHIGNSGGVKLFVNDRELSVSGKSGVPLRLTIPDDIPPE